MRKAAIVGAIVAIAAIVALIIVIGRVQDAVQREARQAEGDPSVPLDCEELNPPIPPACVIASDDPIERLQRATKENNTQDEHRLTAVEAIPIESLTPVERIVAQNAAFILASTGRNRPRAARLVARLALPAATLEALGEMPTPGLAAWIGPPEWQVRSAALTPLQHESSLRFTRRFQPLATANGVHALVGQMVAIDTAWTPHITPVVAGFESLRKRGTRTVACVTELSISLLRCGVPAGLHPDMLEGPPGQLSIFLQRRGPGISACTTCHTFESGLVEQGTEQRLSAHREALLTGARQEAAKVRQQLASESGETNAIP